MGEHETYSANGWGWGKEEELIMCFRLRLLRKTKVGLMGSEPSGEGSLT